MVFKAIDFVIPAFVASQVSVIQHKPIGDWRLATLFLVLPLIHCIDWGMMGKQVQKTVMVDGFRHAARPRHMRYGIKSSKSWVVIKCDDRVCAVLGTY